MNHAAIITLEHGLLDLESRSKLQRPCHRLNKLLSNRTEDLEAKLAAHMDLVARADEALASRAVAELRRDADGLGAALRQLERRDPSGVARLLGIQHTIALEAEVLAAQKPPSLVQAVDSVIAARSSLDELRKTQLSEFNVKLDCMLVEAKQALNDALAKASLFASMRVDALADVEESRAKKMAKMRELTKHIDALTEKLTCDLANGRAKCRVREEVHAALLAAGSRKMGEAHKALKQVAEGIDELEIARGSFVHARQGFQRVLMEYLIACNAHAAQVTAAGDKRVGDVAHAAEEVKQNQRRQMERTLALASAVEELRDCLPCIS